MSEDKSAAVRVQAEEFDIPAEVAAVKKVSRAIGGIVVFVGVVRDFSRGEDVSKLFFEHFPGMTEKKLAELREEAIERFGLREIRIAHRYGELLPGDDVVLIVAASSHRAEAFEAASWCIAELKVRVPIWKKEYTAAGEVWIEEVGK